MNEMCDANRPQYLYHVMSIKTFQDSEFVFLEKFEGLMMSSIDLSKS
jgi:hypothetical protein